MSFGNGGYYDLADHCTIARPGTYGQFMLRIEMHLSRIAPRAALRSELRTECNPGNDDRLLAGAIKRLIEQGRIELTPAGTYRLRRAT